PRGRPGFARASVSTPVATSEAERSPWSATAKAFACDADLEDVRACPGVRIDPSCDVEGGTQPLERYCFHLTQLGQALERLRLDLTHALARQAEPAANVLERLRLRVVEAVTEDDHLSLAIRERRQRLRKRLAPQRSLDRLLRERIVVRHEVAEDSVF